MRLVKDVLSVLWAYDPKEIDPIKHSKLIVSQILNLGNFKATKWLFKFYGKKKVAKIAGTIPLGQWNKKSLALWTLVLGIHPKERKKRIR
jgi:hypothetical protein